MAFDPNTGEWVNDIQEGYGPSGGANAILGLMNVLQSRNDYAQTAAARAIAEQLKTAASPNASGIDPALMAQATGQPADAWTDFYQNTPSQRAINLYSQLPPDKQTDPDEIMRVGVLSGAEPLNAGLASSVKLQDQYRKADTATNNNYTKILDMARKIQTGPHARTNPQEATQQAVAYINAAGPTLGLSPDAVQAAVTELTSSTAGFAVDPKVQAGIDAMNALTDYRKMDTSLLPAHVSAQIAALDAQTRVHDLDASLKNIDVLYARQGKISPEAAAKISAQIAEKQAALEGMSGMTLLMAGGDPNAKAMVDSYMSVQKRTLNQEKAKLMAITGGGVGNAPTAFPDIKAYKDAYFAKHNAYPTPDNVAKAQAQGLVPAGP